MMIDATPLGALTARVMDHIETFGAAHGDEYTIRTAAVVVELDSEKNGRLFALSTDDRPWVLAALLDEAVRSIDQERDALRGQPREDDE
jgi:hypothetical protein